MSQEGARVILKTLNMAETIRWYTTAGFQLRDRFPDIEPHWCEVARDDLVLQFLSGQTPWPEAPVMTGCLYIHPASVTAVHDELRGVFDLDWEVEERDWGRRELVVRDPNGYYLTFAENI